ncbi:MAG: porin [Bacteroidia bacterium]
MLRNKLKTVLIAAAFIPATLMAQESTAPVTTEPDTLTSTVAKLQSDLDLLNRLKFTGYLQAQFQYADSAGQTSFAGGNFPSKVDKRFAVRRGRLKATYNGNMSQYVLQIDVTPGGVIIKDAYAKLTEPWLNSFSLTAGVFNRPFGYEITMSSSDRETPERGRMSQIIFNNERDLGAMITFQPPKTSMYNWLKIDLAMMSGTGPLAADFDKQKDFIGRISYNKSIIHETAKLGVGVSYYQGGFRCDTTVSFKMSDGGFVSSTEPEAIQQILEKQYMGADAQFSIATKAGYTTLRAEYMQGTQPSPNAGGNAQATLLYPGDAATAKKAYYKREFNGAYLYLIQTIGDSKHSIVVKYDWLDPNTKVKGNEIDPTKNLTAGDIKFSTLGVGYIYRWNENVKFTFYYDMVTNETSDKLSGFGKDLTDNVFTARMQYKF